jgi:hypothetical protein
MIRELILVLHVTDVHSLPLSLVYVVAIKPTDRILRALDENGLIEDIGDRVYCPIYSIESFGIERSRLSVLSLAIGHESSKVPRLMALGGLYIRWYSMLKLANYTELQITSSKYRDCSISCSSSHKIWRHARTKWTFHSKNRQHTRT